MTTEPVQTPTSEEIRRVLDERHRGAGVALGAVTADGAMVWGNAEFGEMLDVDPASWYGLGALDVVHPGDVDRAAASLLDTSSHAGRQVPDAFRMRSSDGYRLVQMSGDNHLEDPDAPVIEFELRLADERTRTEALAVDQAEFLTGMALDVDLDDSLSSLVGLAERHGSDGSVCIALLEGGWWKVAAQHLDPRLREAIDQTPASARQLTRSEALRRREPAIDADITQAPWWNDHLAVAAEVGIAACWSFPILGAGAGSHLLGSVDVYRSETGEPDLDEWALFALVARLAGLAIQRSELVQGLRDKADHDHLTSLLNRRGFADRLEQMLSGEGATGLVLIDLDRFKLINDAHGHQIGDQLLVHVSASLKSLAPPDALVGRLGGDEFVIAFPTADEAEAIEHGDRIRAGLKTTRTFSGASISVRASAGCAVSAPEHAVEGDRLIRDADVALYAAKNDGRDQTRMFDDTLRADVDLKVELEADLETALTENQIEVFYQPLIGLATGEIIGVEALARWRRPGHGLVVSADVFIGVAEDTGQVVELDRLVLAQARRDVEQFNSHRSDADHLRLWVNFSARRFTDEALRSDLAPSDGVPLGIELTEHTLAGDPDRAAGLLRQLRRAGSEIAVDDFGTGYSSLHYLHRFPVSRLKIDRSFVAGMADGSRSVAIVEAVVALGRALGLGVTAEGIEDEASLAQLVALGVDVGQGYFFSRPLPVADLVEMFGPGLDRPGHWAGIPIVSAGARAPAGMLPDPAGASATIPETDGSRSAAGREVDSNPTS